jgi:hypothetical protein
MLAAPAAKTWKILPILMVCLVAVAAVACLVHTDPLDQAHADHSQHRHTSSSHITLDLHCLIAILPAMIALVWFCLGTLYIMPLLSNPVALVFPPFIPPKDIAYV